MGASGAIVQATSSPDDVTVRDIAGIWARATARRDAAAPPTDVDTAEAGVRRRLALPGAAILTAHQGQDLVGFAVTAPAEDALELFYLAVDPAAWGLGVAQQLLAGVDAHAAGVGRTHLELWVIDDNRRARTVYERAGWVPTDRTQRDPMSGRVERRLLRTVAET